MRRGEGKEEEMATVVQNYMGMAATKLLAVGEASQVLSVHPNTLRKWSDGGLIPSYRIGQRRDRRFIMSDLVDFMQQFHNGVIGESLETLDDTADPQVRIISLRDNEERRPRTMRVVIGTVNLDNHETDVPKDLNGVANHADDGADNVVHVKPSGETFAAADEA